MSKRKRHQKANAEASHNRPKSQTAASHRPFTELKKLKKELAAPAPPPRPASPAVAKASEELDDESFFARAMEGVKPMSSQDPRPSLRPRSPVQPPDPPDEEAEALVALSEFVAGHGSFDLIDTDEFVEGAASDLDPRVLKKLRRGDFSLAGHVDLHGMVRSQAHEALIRFMNEAQRQGKRCVLIVHGRGLHSKDKRPVLKEAVVTWLGRSALRKQVLAFCSARPSDGGVGALYVLLRKA